MAPHKEHWTKQFQSYRKGSVARGLPVIRIEATNSQVVTRTYTFKVQTRQNGPPGKGAYRSSERAWSFLPSHLQLILHYALQYFH